MTTATTKGKRNPKSRSNPKDAKRSAFLEALQKVDAMGMFVAWETKDGGEYQHQEVVNALTQASLDPKQAREFLPRHAFARACHKMTEDRMIDILREEGDDITFQFTKKWMDEKGEEWKYAKEVLLKLDKITGKIECKNKDLEKLAQDLLNNAMVKRTSSDITAIMHRLFNKHADLFPLTRNGGCYFVPILYAPFVDQLRNFLHSLQGKFVVAPLAKGDSINAANAQDAVVGGIRSVLADYELKIDQFDIRSQGSTLTGMVESLNHEAARSEAYAEFLGDMKQMMLNEVARLQQKLVEKVDKVAEEKKNLPPEQRAHRPGVISVIIECLTGATEKKPITKEEILKTLIEKFPDRSPDAMRSTISSQVPSGLKAEKDIVVHKSNKGFWIPSTNGKA